MATYVYRIKSTKFSSARYGPCEVCRKDASEVFYQVEQTTYQEDDGTIHPTYYGCKNLFGHESCLIGARRSA